MHLNLIYSHDLRDSRHRPTEIPALKCRAIFIASLTGRIFRAEARTQMQKLIRSGVSYLNADFINEKIGAATASPVGCSNERKSS